MYIFKLKKALLVKNISSAFVYLNDRIKNSQVPPSCKQLIGCIPDYEYQHNAYVYSTKHLTYSFDV